MEVILGGESEPESAARLAPVAIPSAAALKSVDHWPSQFSSERRREEERRAMAMEAETAPWRILEFYSGIGGMVGAVALFCCCSLWGF